MIYKLEHNIGGYYTNFSHQFKAKNQINALKIAMQVAKDKFRFEDIDKLDFRIVKWNENSFDYDAQRICDRYCIGIDINKEHYIELNEIR